MSEPGNPLPPAGADKPSQGAVFQHLTRQSWPPEPVAALLLAILSGGGCVGTLLAAQEAGEPRLRMMSIFLIVLPPGSLMIALVSPFVAATITAIGTVRDADPDMLRLLRLTNLSPREIVNGYVWVGLYRLRLLWAICYGLLLPLWGAIVVIIGSPLSYRSIWELVNYAWPAFWIVFCGAVLGTGLNWLAVCVAVSAALRWRAIGHAAGAAAGSALAALILLAASLNCGFITALGTYNVDSTLAVLVAVCIGVAGVYAAAGAMALHSAREAISLEHRESGMLDDAPPDIRRRLQAIRAGIAVLSLVPLVIVCGLFALARDTTDQSMNTFRTVWYASLMLTVVGLPALILTGRRWLREAGLGAPSQRVLTLGGAIWAVYAVIFAAIVLRQLF